jgi:hypothetical protein
MNNIHFITLLLILLCVHVGISVFAWFESRYKPLLNKLNLYQDEVETLHEVAKEYIDLGIMIPSECIFTPQSVLVVEAKRIQTRLFIELVAVGCAGMIPSGLIALIVRIM